MDMKTVEKLHSIGCSLLKSRNIIELSNFLPHSNNKISGFVLQQSKIFQYNISKHNHCQIGTVSQLVEDEKYKSNKKNKSKLRNHKKNQEKVREFKKLLRKTRKSQENKQSDFQIGVYYYN